jgi:hypothetical protein
MGSKGHAGGVSAGWRSCMADRARIGFEWEEAVLREHYWNSRNHVEDRDTPYLPAYSHNVDRSRQRT